MLVAVVYLFVQVQQRANRSREPPGSVQKDIAVMRENSTASSVSARHTVDAMKEDV